MWKRNLWCKHFCLDNDDKCGKQINFNFAQFFSIMNGSTSFVFVCSTRKSCRFYFLCSTFLPADIQKHFVAIVVGTFLLFSWATLNGAVKKFMFRNYLILSVVFFPLLSLSSFLSCKSNKNVMSLVMRSMCALGIFA